MAIFQVCPWTGPCLPLEFQLPSWLDPIKWMGRRSEVTHNGNCKPTKFRPPRCIKLMLDINAVAADTTFPAIPFGRTVTVNKFDVPGLQFEKCLKENIFGILFADSSSFWLAFCSQHSVQKGSFSDFIQVKLFPRYAGGNSMHYGSK